jgi:hypothetical protein
MHQYNNVILEQHKHIGQIINPFILLSNYLIMFPNFYYHTIPQNDLVTHKCTYTQTHTNKSQNNICIYIHT